VEPHYGWISEPVRGRPGGNLAANRPASPWFSLRPEAFRILCSKNVMASPQTSDVECLHPRMTRSLENTASSRPPGTSQLEALAMDSNEHAHLQDEAGRNDVRPNTPGDARPEQPVE
jgi:hypothetical protein